MKIHALSLIALLALLPACQDSDPLAPIHDQEQPRFSLGDPTPLYDQTSPSMYSIGWLGYLGDDFTVPAGQVWNVTRVSLGGFQSAFEVVPMDVGILMQDPVNWWEPATPLHMYSGLMPFVDVYPTGSSRYNFDLPDGGVVLQPGRYWLVERSSVFSWKWANSNNGQTGSGFNDSWIIGMSIQKDLMFSLYGVDLAMDPAARVQLLIEDVDGLNLTKGARTALLSKLNLAVAALAQEDTASACMYMQDFISQLQAQAGKKNRVSLADAQVLIDRATAIRVTVGC
jgi:hypothetical protein